MFFAEAFDLIAFIGANVELCPFFILASHELLN